MRPPLLLFAIALLTAPIAAAGPEANALQPIGPAVSAARTDRDLRLTCADGSTVALSVLAPDLIRVRTRFAGQPAASDHSWAIARTDWPVASWQLTETPAAFTLTTAELKVVVHRDPLLVEFRDLGTDRVLNADQRPMARDAKSGLIAAAKVLGFDEHFYGLGEKAAHLDRRRGQFVLWNSDTPGYTEGTDPIYQSIPFYLGLEEGRAYGLFYDNSRRTTFDFGHTSQDATAYTADGGMLDYYFFSGPGLKKILGRYTELTGRMPLPPLWALGNQQSRYSYYPAAMVSQVAAAYRAHDLPLDVLYLDIHYMDAYRVFTWDAHRFPDPAALTAALGRDGIKVVTILDPGVKYQPTGGYSVFDDGLAHDYFLRRADGSLYLGEVWPGPAVFVDYTREDELVVEVQGVGIVLELQQQRPEQGHAGAMRLLEGRVKERQQAVAEFQVIAHDGFVRRAVAPRLMIVAVDRAMVAAEGREARHLVAAHQQFAIPAADEARDVGAEKGFPGQSQRGEHGDVQRQRLKRGVVVARPHRGIALDAGVAGAGNDERPAVRLEPRQSFVGRAGHGGRENIPVLGVRRAGALVIEDHVVLGSAALVGKVGGFIHVRPDARYTPVGQGMQLIAPPAAGMVGDALLAAPVLRAGERAREVYLPPGRWFDYWSGTPVTQGDFFRVDAPLGRLPLFVRGGSVIPSTEAMSHTGEKPWNPLRFDLYPDDAGKAAGSLYEDDGASPAYLQGAFRRTTLTLAGGRLTLSVAGPFTPPARRFEFILHAVAAPHAVALDGQRLPAADWSAEADGRLVIRLVDDGRAHTLELQ